MEWIIIIFLVIVIYYLYNSSKKSESKTNTPAPPIKQVSAFPSSIEIHLPISEVNEDISIRSFTEVGKNYTINLHTVKCSCEDFLNTRANKRIDSIERLCKHLRKAIIGSSHIKNTVYESILSETYSSKSYCKLENVDAIVGFTEGNEWLNIYKMAQPDKNGETKYARYGYSLIENRWSYGRSPFDYEKIESMIYKNFPTGPDAVQRRNNRNESVVIEVKFTPEDLTRVLSSEFTASKTKAISGTL